MSGPAVAAIFLLVATAEMARSDDLPEFVPDYDGYYSRLICGVDPQAPLPVNTDCSVILPGNNGEPVEYLGASVDLEGIGWLNLQVFNSMVLEDMLGPVPYHYILRGADERAQGRMAAYATIMPNVRLHLENMNPQPLELADVLLACQLTNYYSTMIVKIGPRDPFVAPTCSIKRRVRADEADPSRGLFIGDTVLSHFAVSDSDGQWYWINREDFDALYGDAFAAGGFCNDGDTREGCQGCRTTELGGEAALPYCEEYTGPSPERDAAVADQAAEFSALVVAELETGENRCSQFFFVNPRIVESLQFEQFPVLQAVGDAKARQLMEQQIQKVLQDVAAQGDSVWCRDYRDRMKRIGGPFAALFEE